jgi:hypothetical protein
MNQRGHQHDQQRNRQDDGRDLFRTAALKSRLE